LLRAGSARCLGRVGADTAYQNEDRSDRFKQNSVDRKLDHPKEEKPTKIYTPQQLFSNAKKIIIFVQAFQPKEIQPVPRFGSDGINDVLAL